ncbi:MAG: hypothetical protein V2A66_01245 [Pseudomonadota bacterium]
MGDSGKVGSSSPNAQTCSSCHDLSAKKTVLDSSHAPSSCSSLFAHQSSSSTTRAWPSHEDSILSPDKDEIKKSASDSGAPDFDFASILRSERDSHFREDASLKTCSACYATTINHGLFSETSPAVSGQPFQNTAPGHVSPLMALVETMPAAIPPDASLEGELKGAMAAFKKAVDGGDQAAQEKAFEKIIETGARRHHLEGLYASLEKSKQTKRIIESEVKKEKELLRASLHSSSSCHDDPADAVAKKTRQKAVEFENDLRRNDPVSKQDEVIAARRKISEESLSAFESDLLEAVGQIDRNNPFNDGVPQELTLSPVAASIFADTFKSFGDFDRAKKYYNIASASPVQSASGGAWYHMQALEMDVYSGDQERIKASIKVVEEVRDGLTDLLFRAYDEQIIEERPQMMPVGTPSQVYELDALRWGILYDAYTQLDGDNKAELQELEKERRQMVAGRIGKATAVEARLHIRNMDRVAVFKTARSGDIERALREEDQNAAAVDQRQLIDDVHAVERLVKPYLKPEKGDVFFEQVATLYWRTYFNGNFVRDLPQAAIFDVSDFVLKPMTCQGYGVALGETNYIESQLKQLRQVAPQVFTAGGKLNRDVDLSGTAQGEDAAKRVMSAYWKSNDAVREAGVPLGLGVGCFATGAFFSETVIIPMVAALLCGSGGSFLNREINKSSASEQYRQASMTGISVIGEKEAGRMRSGWYFSEGINNLFNAAAVVPMAALWGRLGTQAVKAGLAGAGTWAFAETGGRALMKSMASSPLKFAGSAMAGIGRGGKAALGWYWKLPIGTKFRVAGTGAGLGAAVADYALIDRDGNFVWGDGELDHWYGYAGLAAGMSEGGYRLFKASWRSAFAEAVGKSRVRSGLIRLGTDMVAVDYYMVKPKKDGGYEFVDFGAPRKTPIEKHDFEKQFDVDTWFGRGGLMLASGDWMQSEWGIMSNWDRAFLGAGSVPFLVDVASDGELNKWYGGLGGSVAVSVLGNRLLNVSAAGSMIFLPMKLSYEYLMQLQQDVEPTAPDPKRMMSSTAESIFMMMLVKGTYQGAHYWNTFPFGKNMLRASERIPVVRNFRGIQNWGNYAWLGNQTIEVEGSPKMTIHTGSPQIESWKPVEVSPLNTRKVNGPAGKGVEINYKLRGDKLWNGADGGQKDQLLRIVRRGASTKFYLNETAVTEQDLLNQGYLWREEKLTSFQPDRKGAIRMFGRKMTVDEVQNLNDGARSKALGELKDHGWRPNGDHFERWWIEHPYHPEVLLENPTSAMSTADFKILKSVVEVGGKEVPVWLKFSRRTVSADQVVVGGSEITLWKGLREKPRFTIAGVGAQFFPIVAEAWGANSLIFRKTASGDPSYQPLQRVSNYVPTILGTWPFIQAPRGMDTVSARFWGGVVGYAPNLLGNALFPAYRNTAPGQVRLYNHLDAGGSTDSSWWNPLQMVLSSGDAFESFGKITTSLNVGPWGPARGSTYEIEDIAMDNLRYGLNCRMDMAHGKKMRESEACVMLPEKTQKQILDTDRGVNPDKMKRRFDAWAKIFREKMDVERKGDLSERDRRLVIVLGAWFKSLVNTRGDQVELVNLKQLISDYGWFFDKTPNLSTDSEWNDYISQVNGGRSNMSNFYFDPHMQDSAAPAVDETMQ